LKVCSDIPAYVPTPPAPPADMRGSFCTETYAEGSPCYCIAEAAVGVDETTCNGVITGELAGKMMRVAVLYEYDRTTYVCALGNGTALLQASLPNSAVTLSSDRITNASQIDSYACYVEADYARVLQANVLKRVSFSADRRVRCCTFASALPATPSPAPTPVAREPYLDYVVSLYSDGDCSDHLQSFNVSTVKLPARNLFDDPTIEPFCINTSDFSLRLLLNENHTTRTAYVRPVYGLYSIEAVACVKPACCVSNSGDKITYDTCAPIIVYADGEYRSTASERKFAYLQLSRSYKPPKFNVDGSGRLLEPLPFFHFLIDAAFSLPLLVFTLW
jgi:hypothetical protein